MQSLIDRLDKITQLLINLLRAFSNQEDPNTIKSIFSCIDSLLAIVEDYYTKSPYVEIAKEYLVHINDLKNTFFSFLQLLKRLKAAPVEEAALLRPRREDGKKRILVVFRDVVQSGKLVKIYEGNLARVLGDQGAEIGEAFWRALMTLKQIEASVINRNLQNFKVEFREALAEINNVENYIDHFSLFGEYRVDLSEMSLAVLKIGAQTFKFPEKMEEFLQGNRKIIVLLDSILIRCKEAGFIEPEQYLESGEDSESEFSEEENNSDEEFAVHLKNLNLKQQEAPPALPQVPEDPETPHSNSTSKPEPNPNPPSSQPNPQSTPSNPPSSQSNPPSSHSNPNSTPHSKSNPTLQSDSKPATQSNPPSNSNQPTPSVASPNEKEEKKPKERSEGRNRNESIKRTSKHHHKSPSSSSVSKHKKRPESDDKLQKIEKNEKNEGEEKPARRQRSKSERHKVEKLARADGVLKSDKAATPLAGKEECEGSEKGTNGNKVENKTDKIQTETPSKLKVTYVESDLNSPPPPMYKPFSPEEFNANITATVKFKTELTTGSTKTPSKIDTASPQTKQTLFLKNKASTKQLIRQSSKKVIGESLRKKSQRSMKKGKSMEVHFRSNDDSFEKTMEVFYRFFPHMKEEYEKLDEEKKIEFQKALFSTLNSTRGDVRDSKNKKKSEDSMSFDDSELTNLIEASVADLATRKQTFGFRQKRKIQSMKILDVKMWNDTGFNFKEISDNSLEIVKRVYLFIDYYDEYFKLKDKEYFENKVKRLPDTKTQERDAIKKSVFLQVKLFYQYLEIIFGLMNGPDVSENPELSASYLKTLSKITTPLETTKYLTVDLELYNSGRYDRLIERNLLVWIYRKTSIFMNSIIQLVIDLYLKFSDQSSTIDITACYFHLFSLYNSIHKSVMSILVYIETIHYLQNQEPKEKEKKDLSFLITAWDTEREKNITQLNDKEQPGDLSDMVFRLAPPHPHMTDQDFLSAVFLVTRSTIPPEDFFEVLVQRHGYAKVDNSDTEQNVKIIKARTIMVLINWLKTNHFLIEIPLFEKIRVFLESNSTKEQITKIQEFNKEVFALPSSIVRKVPESISSFQSEFSPFDMIIYFPDSIARQLTLIEFELFSKLQEIEFQGQVWNKEKTHAIAPNLLELIERANAVSYWVAISILSQSRLKDRVNVVSNFIKLAAKLKELNNFNTLMAIIAGFNIASVSRLKNTFSNLKKSQQEHWEEIADTMNPAHNFKKYKAALAAAGCSAIPYVGMILANLTAMEDGNDDFVVGDDNKKKLNISKYVMIHKIISNTLSYYTYTTNFTIEKEDPLYSFCLELPSLPDEELYELSLLREPRE